jgi:hypothetical protein
VGPLLVDNLIIAGLLLGVLALLVGLLHLQERLVGRYLAHHLGWRSVLLTGWLGVPLHELSHLLAALIFRHRVIAWSLLDPDPVSGTLGYVRHAYSRRSGWQLLGTLAIGLAPLVAGLLLVAALLGWMVPASGQDLLRRALSLGANVGVGELADELRALVVQLGGAVWRERGLLLPLQLYLAICVANHLAPSPSDLGGALPGAALALLVGGGGVLLAGRLGVSLRPALGALVPLVLLYLAVSVFQTLWVGAAAIVVRLSRRAVVGRGHV